MLRHLTFRNLAAAFCGSAAILFLTINSIILARGAGRWAVSSWDAFSYMLIAGTVPWIIALMPFLFAVTWKRGRRMGRPTLWSLVMLGVWLIFVGYNVLGAGGAVNFTRTDVLATRKHDASRAAETAQERARLVALRDAIPSTTRPAALLRPLLEAEQAKPAWEWTERCREPRTGSQRKFCGAYAALASELGAAEELDRLTAQIAALDRQATGTGLVDVVDPAAAFWTYWTGAQVETVQAVIPLATPIVLEIGSMVFLSFALLLAGFRGHRDVLFNEVPRSIAHPAEQGEAAAGQTGATLTPALPPPFRDPVSRGRELAAWFFSECTRPVLSGGLPEDRWYALYAEQCERSNDKPIPLEEFRALAQKHGARPVLIDGQWLYQRVLPLVPREGAA